MSHYFVIRSQSNPDLVLDVWRDSSLPGTPVIVWDAKPEGKNSNQLWYEDTDTSTIRSKLNNFCLDVAGDPASGVAEAVFRPFKMLTGKPDTRKGESVVINPYQAGRPHQEWTIMENTIFNKGTGVILSISDGRDTRGTAVVVAPNQGAQTQFWSFHVCKDDQSEFSLDPSRDSLSTRPAASFYICSDQSDLVMDVKTGEGARGTPLILYKQKKKDNANQLWYMDSDGVIRSRLNDFVIDATDDILKIQPYENDNYLQQWTVDRKKQIIMNKRNKHLVIDVEGGRCRSMSNLCTATYQEMPTQCWRIEYADMPKNQTQGGQPIY